MTNCTICLKAPCECDDDPITVVEDYCIACQGKCTNDDPSDYGHMIVEWEQLADAWIDRGATASDIWSFLATVVIKIASNNDVTLDEFHEVMNVAWKKFEESDEDD